MKDSEYYADKNYFSFGGGVNSTALLLLLVEKEIPFEAVFAEHGGDFPETYEYVDMLLSKGYPITVLPTRVDGQPLYEWCHERRMIPMRRSRWCTVNWKAKPLDDYYEKPCFNMLGISSEESHRAKRGKSETEGIVRDYPLISWGVDRHECKRIIKRHGLKPPRRSGCYFCPFMKKSQLLDLRWNYPELWCKTLELETRCADRQKALGKKPYYLHNSNRPLEVVVQENQLDMFDPKSDEAACVCRT